MKAVLLWWNGLQRREQQLLSALGVVGGIGLFYALIWAPLHQARDSQQLAARAAAEQLVWLKGKMPQLAAAPSAATTGSLSDKVSQTSRQFQINVSRMQPKDEQLDLMLEDVSFEQLLRWLQLLQTDHGVQLVQLEVSDTDVSGVVRVRRLVLE
jgi:general secretion pathway protein M